jgi:trehalose synthase
VLDDLLRHAENLRGARVLHVNATPYGGGVSELLRSGVPILNDLGLIAHWKIISGDERFFQVTKKIHNGLQGAPGELTESDSEAYLGTSPQSELLRKSMTLSFPTRTAGILSPEARAMPGGSGGVISTPRSRTHTWAFARLPHAVRCGCTTMEDLFSDCPIGRAIAPPAIDPLSPKNMPLADATARGVLEDRHRVDRPLVSQVSRFDPGRPLGVMAAYRLAREAVPTLQLALVGSMAWTIQRAGRNGGWGRRHADPNVHVFTNLTVPAMEVNAF